MPSSNIRPLIKTTISIAWCSHNSTCVFPSGLGNLNTLYLFFCLCIRERCLCLTSVLNTIASSHIYIYKYIYTYTHIHRYIYQSSPLFFHRPRNIHRVLPSSRTLFLERVFNKRNSSVKFDLGYHISLLTLYLTLI